jgi:hypothetical protein
MPLIKPKLKGEKVTFKVNMNSHTANEIKHYCEFAGFKNNDEFLEEAATHILSKDKDFKEWREKAAQKV